MGYAEGYSFSINGLKYNFTDYPTFYHKGVDEDFHYIEAVRNDYEHKLKNVIPVVVTIKKAAEAQGLKFVVYGSAGRIPLFRKVLAAESRGEVFPIDKITIGYSGHNGLFSLPELFNMIKINNFGPLREKTKAVSDAEEATRKERKETGEKIMLEIMNKMISEGYEVITTEGNMGKELAFKTIADRDYAYKIYREIGKIIDTKELVNGSTTYYDPAKGFVLQI